MNQPMYTICERHDMCRSNKIYDICRSFIIHYPQWLHIDHFMCRGRPAQVSPIRASHIQWSTYGWLLRTVIRSQQSRFLNFKIWRWHLFKAIRRHLQCLAIRELFFLFSPQFLACVDEGPVISSSAELMMSVKKAWSVYHIHQLVATDEPI